MCQWFKDRGQWFDGSAEPVPGMIIFFDWNNENGQDGESDHVGIVEKVENGIAVKENYKGQGIGSQLIAYAEHYAKEHNIDLMILNSSIRREKAHRFYKKLGFENSLYSFRKKICVVKI